MDGAEEGREIVKRLWPEIDWIENLQLREQVTQVWIKALERSPLQPELVPNCPITFMQHKRCVVHIARASGKAMRALIGRVLPLDLDTVSAEAILADVGNLLEYELGPDGQNRQSERGEALRHPSPELPWRWSAAFRTPCATLLRRTPGKAIWSSALLRHPLCITLISWRSCPSEGRFLECINCRLRFEFPAGAHYDTLAKRFESHPCNHAPDDVFGVTDTFS